MQEHKISTRTTLGDKYNPAMQITDLGEAREYFDRLVEHCMRTSHVSYGEAVHLERQNLGYMAGYYDHDTRLRVERLFGAEHPILGSVEIPYTTQELFDIGMKVGQLKAENPEMPIQFAGEKARKQVKKKPLSRYHIARKKNREK